MRYALPREEVCLLALVLALAAWGADELGVDVQLFAPSEPGDPLLWTQGTGVQPGWSGRATLSHALDPLIYEHGDGVQRERVVAGLSQLDLQAAYGVGRLLFSADLPLALTSSETFPGSAGLGELSLRVRAVALPRSGDAPGLAVSAGVGLPTVTAGPGLGTGGLRGTLGLVVDGEVGPVLLGADLGVELSPEAELEQLVVGDALLAHLGAAWALGDDRGLSLELGGQASLHGLGTRGAAPVEVLVGGWVPAGERWLARVGLGRGLTPGVGSTAARLVLSIEPRPDLAGLDPDPDGDGILTVVDVCPFEPELVNGVRDADGCPEAPAVLALLGQDGGQSSLPQIPTYTDEDGDGIDLQRDICPNDPEDLDGFEDEDGCPDHDEDEDGIADHLDRCPRVAENIDGYQDEDGCPDSSSKQVLEYATGITFETASDRLRASSLPVMDQVMAVLWQYPEGTLRVEGHTDDQGPAQANLDLSSRRCQTIKDWLVERGIEPDRIQVRGFGESRPVDTNTTPEGRARNRRVEITLMHPEPP